VWAVSLPYSSGISEWSCECAVNLDHPLLSAVHNSDVSYKSRIKAKVLQDVIEIRVFHTVRGRGLIERYDCKRQMYLVGVVYVISDGVNNLVGYTTTAILLARQRAISL
jgi:hypothetical protein